MTPPKRALFSLNLDSEIDHVRQRVEDHNLEGSERVKVLETKGPTKGHTNLSFVGKPFENLVNKTVDSVVEGTGKKLHTAEGEITYSKSETRNSSSSGSGRTINLKNSIKKGPSIEEQYDTSEL